MPTLPSSHRRAAGRARAHASGWPPILIPEVFGQLGQHPFAAVIHRAGGETAPRWRSQVRTSVGPSCSRMEAQHGPGSRYAAGAASKRMAITLLFVVRMALEDPACSVPGMRPSSSAGRGEHAGSSRPINAARRCLAGCRASSTPWPSGQCWEKSTRLVRWRCGLARADRGLRMAIMTSGQHRLGDLPASSAGEEHRAQRGWPKQANTSDMRERALRPFVHRGLRQAFRHRDSRMPRLAISCGQTQQLPCRGSTPGVLGGNARRRHALDIGSAADVADTASAPSSWIAQLPGRHHRQVNRVGEAGDGDPEPRKPE